MSARGRSASLRWSDVMRRFQACTRGTVAIMAAGAMTMVLGAAVIAVDLAALFTNKRQAQGAVDLAAMAAAGDLARAHDAAAATLSANGIIAKDLAVETGHYKADSQIVPELRFVAGGTPVNAARVRLTTLGHSHFARFFSMGVPVIGVQGTAHSATLASLSVGSRLLAVREGFVNQLLGGLLGSNLALSAMDYEALAQASVSLLPLMKGLATELNLTGATYNDVLTSSATAGDLFSAMASVMAGSGGTSAAQAAIQSLAQQTKGSTVTVPLSTMMDMGPLGQLKVADSIPGFDASYTAMDLINAAAVAAGGASQVTVNLGVNIPGLTSLSLDVAIGEPPQGISWTATGEPGVRVRTAQTRLRLVATVAGKGLLAGVGIRLPIYVQVAHAEAKLDSVVCSPKGGVESVGVAAQPGIAEAWIGEISGSMSNFNFAPTVKSAKLVDAAIARVTGSAHVLAGNTSWSTLSFTKSDIDGAVVKTAGTSNLADSLVSSLVKGLNLQVDVLGLNLGIGSLVSGVVAQVLGDVAAPLDTVVFGLLGALGVNIGEADVRVHGALCNGARLTG